MPEPPPVPKPDEKGDVERKEDTPLSLREEVILLLLLWCNRILMCSVSFARVSGRKIAHRIML